MKMLLILGLLIYSMTLATIAEAKNGPINCYIQTANGRYLTAVGGGGRIDDTIHSDATKPRAWERFTLEDSGAGTPIVTYGIKTMKGYYLYAIQGGGQLYNVIHTNATQLRAWEEFQLISLSGGYFAIKTRNGNYLTAMGGGGRIRDVIHSDATQVRAWEKFKLNCSK